MKGLFLDRDGVINEERGFAYRIEDMAFKPGLFPFLRAAVDAGYKLVIVTNQAGVAYGYYEEEDFHKVMAYMRDVFAKEGLSIARILGCFECNERPSARPPYNRESFWRKPAPGMILEGALKERLDVTRSIMIGDKKTDMIAAQAASVAKPLWLLDNHTETMEGVTNITSYEQAYPFL